DPSVIFIKQHDTIVLDGSIPVRSQLQVASIPAGVSMLGYVSSFMQSSLLPAVDLSITDQDTATAQALDRVSASVTSFSAAATLAEKRPALASVTLSLPHEVTQAIA
ncbi:hypothetical protein KIPB_016003, partial [Kipferlia bialata]